VENRSIAKALFAEFFGTFALVFTIILVVSMYALQADVARGLTYPFIALAHFLILFLLIQTVGAVSGGHFNPAVTLGVFSIRRISAANAVGYVLVQLAGAVVAALLIKALIPNQADAVKYASTAVNADISTGAAMVLEAIMTFFLVWTVVGTAVNPNGPKEWAPLAISGALALGVLLIAPLTGASINPARSFGPALISGNWGSVTDYLLPYVVGPLAGGVLAALAYSAIYISEGGPAKRPPAPSEQSPL
jgi:MIP family channel proteins